MNIKQCDRRVSICCPPVRLSTSPATQQNRRWCHGRKISFAFLRKKNFFEFLETRRLKFFYVYDSYLEGVAELRSCNFVAKSQNFLAEVLEKKNLILLTGAFFASKKMCKLELNAIFEFERKINNKRHFLHFFKFQWRIKIFRILKIHKSL